MELGPSNQHSNSNFIRALQLAPHPEGGHFAVTYVSPEHIPSPYAEGRAERTVQSTIYYLLSMQQDAPDDASAGIHGHSSAIGVMHKNRSTTMHLLHSGRAVYTLLSTSKPVQVRTVVMGEDASKGEVRQLVVDGDWWKVSEIPAESRASVERGEVEADSVGCLISEVVTPGFDWEDHSFLTTAKLDELLDGDKEMMRMYERYCRT